MLEDAAPPDVGNDEASKYIDGFVNRANKMLILVDLNIRLSEAEWGHIAEL
jgi:chemotaxis signal transduction protein